MSCSHLLSTAFVALLSCLAAAEARAATFTIDRTDDSQVASTCDDAVADDCSLRGVVIAANADPAVDVMRSRRAATRWSWRETTTRPPAATST